MSEATPAGDGLERDDKGTLVHVVWALRPGRPQIVAICSTTTLAARYETAGAALYPGARMHSERVYLDHLFGSNDVQSVIYRAGLRGQRDGD